MSDAGSSTESSLAMVSNSMQAYVGLLQKAK